MRYRQIVGLLVFSINLTSCSLFKTSCTRNATTDVTDTDSLSVIYNDSIDDILIHANKIRLYDMADFIMSNDSIENTDSIFNYKIKKKIGLLKKKEKDILSFIISDRNWYIKDYAPVRQPFHPNLALEFIHKKANAFMFVSFGTGEVAISDIKGNFKFFRMQNNHLMERWAYTIFPEEEYYKELIKR